MWRKATRVMNTHEATTNMYTSDPAALDVSTALAEMDAGRLTSVALVAACLAHIDERDEQVQAWVTVARDTALAVAREMDRGPKRGPLHGIPIGVKDIVETAHLPTRYGSPIYANHQPLADAACVSLLRQAGAIVMGKTVTTEFAVRYPNKTRNPHNLKHTPGGSSSGSAAAVASNMVPLALGTQTAGSIIRPAAFCGVVGYKPTIGRFSYVGIKLLSRSLDTLGGMARSVADFGPLRAAMLGASAKLPELERKPRIGFCRTPWWDEADSDTQALMEAQVAQLVEAGADVREVALDARFKSSGAANEVIMGYEGCRAMALELEQSPHLLSATLREVMSAGKSLTYTEYQAALADVNASVQSFTAAIGELDALLVPSAPGGAPASLDSTGNALFNRPWTTIGVPCVSVPAGTAANGMPLGVQFVGRHDDDERVLSVARWYEALALV
jgi:Asp-tRNA(Asn)/Glu-tRNA(Gln) amidotransferase A subunit family amidase